MAAAVDEFRHIDMSRVAVSFRQTRKPTTADRASLLPERRPPHGLYASLTPLRFPGGQTHALRRGRKFSIQRVEVDGREMLYVLNFYLPRFLDLSFREKLTTIAHELLHIGPQFDGDLRRFAGRCYAHSRSHAQFDAQAEQLVERWLARRPDESLYAFLHLDFLRLQAVHGGIYGRRIAAPSCCRRNE